MDILLKNHNFPFVPHYNPLVCISHILLKLGRYQEMSERVLFLTQYEDPVFLDKILFVLLLRPIITVFFHPVFIRFSLPLISIPSLPSFLFHYSFIPLSPFIPSLSSLLPLCLSLPLVFRLTYSSHEFLLSKDQRAFLSPSYFHSCEQQLQGPWHTFTGKGLQTLRHKVKLILFMQCLITKWDVSCHHGAHSIIYTDPTIPTIPSWASTWQHGEDKLPRNRRKPWAEPRLVVDGKREKEKD